LLFPVRTPPSFAEHSRKLARGIAVAIVLCLLLAGWIAAVTWWPWLVYGAARRGVAVGLLFGPGAVWLAALPSWSVRSHELAIAHGQICRWSSSWAVFGWWIPGVQLWLPFSILRARGRFYGLLTMRRLWWAQVSFCFAVLQVFTPWFAVAGIAAAVGAAVGFYWLRASMLSVAEKQVLAEQSATAERVFG
jgi:hypothetical protein